MSDNEEVTIHDCALALAKLQNNQPTPKQIQIAYTKLSKALVKLIYCSDESKKKAMEMGLDV